MPRLRMRKSLISGQKCPTTAALAGDHEKLIRMDREDFMALMGHAGHARFAARM